LTEKVTRRRAYLYITRELNEQVQVAVFRHPDFEVMTLGTQVPGGTIEPHETPAAGALREAVEESGVDGFVDLHLLARDSWHGDHDDTVRERYFYQLRVAQPLPDSWEHTVSDGELDKGLVFEYRWLSVADAQRVLGHMGDYLHLLE
jgi:8-oxo-dGTP pyrophosphatase MutT (NUDIX family)